MYLMIQIIFCGILNDNFKDDVLECKCVVKAKLIYSFFKIFTFGVCFALDAILGSSNMIINNSERTLTFM